MLALVLPHVNPALLFVWISKFRRKFNQLSYCTAGQFIKTVNLKQEQKYLA
jgi:hypothetical protein